MILSKKHDFPLITVQSFDFLYICRNSLHKQEDLFIKTELIRHENKNIFIVFGKSIMIMIILCLLINMYLFVHGAGREKRVNIFKTAYPMKQLIGYENVRRDRKILTKKLCNTFTTNLRWLFSEFLFRF